MAQTPTSKPTIHGPRLGLLLIVLVVMIAVVLRVGRSDGGGEDRVPWMRDYAAALGAAQATDKPILANFTADWCPPCQEMDRHVYSQPRVAASIDARFVPLKIDLTDPDRRQQALALRYGALGTPTLVVLDDRGTALATAAGYVDADTLMAWLEKYGKPPADAVGSAAIPDPSGPTAQTTAPQPATDPQGTPP